MELEGKNHIGLYREETGRALTPIRDRMLSQLPSGEGAGRSYFSSLLAQNMADTLLPAGENSEASLLQEELGLSSLLGGSDTGSNRDALLMMCMMIAMGQGSGDMSSLFSLLAMGGNGGSATGGVTAAQTAYQNASRSYNAQQSYSLSGSGRAAIPAEAYKSVTPGMMSTEATRSAGLYTRVIEQFRVETSTRYQPYRQGKGDTYCNIFVWDVTRAMGAEIPHYIDADTWEARYYPDTRGTIEMNAVRMCRWLEEKGPSYGWVEVSAEQAQNTANRGRPAVAVLPTHVQMVCPSKSDGYDPQKGVAIAQAGAKLTSYGYSTDIYGKNSLAKVKYYAHP